MGNSINNSTESLADIVGINAIIEPSISSPLLVVLLTITISVVVSYLYYKFMHGFNAQLRHIKYQLMHQQLLPRDAAHKIATLSNKKPLIKIHHERLKRLRFASSMPSKEQMIEFINHVE